MNLAPVFKKQPLDQNGRPLAGAKLYSYITGTSTPLRTFADARGSAFNTNPVVFDASGRATVFIDQTLSYRFVLIDANGVLRWELDQVSAPTEIGTPAFADGAITELKIANNAASSDKLRSSETVDSDRAVTTNHMRDQSVTQQKLDPDFFTGIPDNDSLTHLSDHIQIKDQGLGKGKFVSNFNQSLSSGGFTTTGSSFVDVFPPGGFVRVEVNFTATGRPVLISLSGSGIYVNSTSSGSTMGSIVPQVRVNSSAGVVATFNLARPPLTHNYSTGLRYSPTSFRCFHTPSAGAITYWLEARGGVYDAVIGGSAAGLIDVSSVYLNVHEL